MDFFLQMKSEMEITQVVLPYAWDRYNILTYTGLLTAHKSIVLFDRF